MDAAHTSTYCLCCATLAAAIFVAGCAPGNHQPILTYPPAAESGAPQAAAPKNKQIILNPFLDQRADKTSVGTVRSGVGARATDIVPANDVADWVMQALKTELQNSGYVVTTGSTGRDTLPGASAAVSGEILNVFCDPSHAGKVSLVAKVKKAGKDVMQKNYSGEASAQAACGRSAQSSAQALELALASALRQFVAELDKSLTTP
jgi:hypothetical protein